MIFEIIIVYCIVEFYKGVKFVMKNYVQKGISLTLVATMTICCLSGCGNTQNTDMSSKIDKAGKNTSSTNVEALLTSKLGEAKDIDKKETVYVEMNADGSVSKTTVSNVLKVTGKDNISDVSNLNDIVNISGDELFAKGDNGKLIWENKGENISYQGTTTQATPINIDITYYLDGKEISAEELAGKSGKVKIVYDYKNNTLDSGSFVPFLALTGMVLNSDFSNVAVDNGKLVEYNDSNIVVGYAAPGFKDELLKTIDKADKYIGDIEIPESVTVTADVKNFSMDMTLTAVTSKLGDMDLENTLDFSDVDEKMKELSEGADKLADGAGKLNSGAGQLKDGSAKLNSGAADLAKYTGILSAGTTELLDKYSVFNKALLEGVASADSGAKKVYKGTKDLKSGAKSLDDGAKKLDSGAKTLDSGAKKLDTAAKKLDSGAGELSTGLSTAKAAFEDTKKADGTVEAGLNSGSKALAAGAKEANAGVKELAATLQETPSSIQKQIDGIIAQLSTATGGMIGSEAALNQVVEGINGAVKQGMDLNTVLQAKGLDIATYYTLLQAYYSVQTLESVKSTFESQIQAKVAEIKKLLSGMSVLEAGAGQISSGISTLYAGISQLNTGAGSLAGGTSQLKNGTGELSAGTKNLAVGTKDLSAGAKKLKDGTGTLNTGMKQLSNGTGEMKSKLGAASPQIKEGIGTVNSGAAQIGSGADTLSDGVKTLTAGIVTLADGTQELKSGAIKLNDEGISKITSIFGKDAKDAIHSIEDILNAGKKYKSFTGINNDMSGDVKFIFKTAEIKADK